MTLKLLLAIGFFLLNPISLFAQHIIGQIIDAKTNGAIAFATIQFNKNNGVVSNSEGYFALPLNNLNSQTILTISYMGYQTESISLDDLEKKKNLIKLYEAVNQLNTVYVTNKVPSADSIMARVNRNLKINYQETSVKQTLFTRETTFFKVNTLEMDIEKSSGFNKKQIEDSNSQFKVLTEQIVNNPPTQSFTDAQLEFYYKPDSIAKMSVFKATQLIDQKNSLSIETIQDKATTIVLQHLDTTKTYKVKTGWFTIEDSLSLKNNEYEIEDADAIDTKAIAFKSLKTVTLERLSAQLFGNKSVLDFVLEINDYDYQLNKITTINDQLIYIVNFEPRRSRAKFKGTLYVNADNYAIQKLDYKYAEGKVGEKLNLKLLLGLKYVEKANSGTVLYKKNIESDKYFVHYINVESKRYVYAHRPFKFIENANNSRNKVNFDMTIDGDIVEKYELMSLEHHVSNDHIFNGFTELKTVDYMQLKTYDPTIWKDIAIMEPLEELKKFKVEE